jgi:ABC-type multidrug transport system fused ATPase/permease subunit
MDRKKYGILSNLYFYCKESFNFRKLGFILSLFLVPTRIMKSFLSIFIPKLVIDSIENLRGEYTFLVNIIIVTVVIAVTSIIELLAKNTMEHNMNSFVLIRLNKLWIEKVSTMDYEVFTSELGKQSSSKARMTLEGTTRWGIGTYIPRLLELLTSFIGFIIYGIILVYVHPFVLVALIVAYGINMAVTLHAEKKKQLLKDDVAKAERKMNYFAYNTRGLSIAKDIRVYSMREWIRQMATMARFDKKNVDDKVYKYQVFVLIVNGVVVLLRDGVVYSILIWLTLKGDITIGNFALYAATVNGLGDWLTQITTGIGAFREADNNVTDFRQFLSLPDGRIESKETLELVAAPGIKLDKVSFSYDGKNNVLDNVSLEVKPGEKIAVVGSNGAGKTTLIKLICGLLHPICGQILIDGVSVSSVAQEDYSKAISAVFQDSALLPVSIKHNIVMNDKKINEDKLTRVVTLVGLEEKIASLEMGIDTPLVKHITENGTEFSGGEVQKLLLARAIYKDSPILILDEPTAAMDPIAEQNVYLKYNELAKDKTAFFISHRLSSTRFCDKILLIDDGRIREVGTHDELMNKRGLYHDMYMIQSKYYQEEC